MTSSAHTACLHLLMSPQPAALKDCLSHCQDGDSVVLVDNAVSLLLQENLWLEASKQAWPEDHDQKCSGVQLFALEADVLARGISAPLTGVVSADLMAGSNSLGACLIEDADWARLVMKFAHCLSWK